MSESETPPILPQHPGPNGAPPDGYAEYRGTCPVAHVRLPSGDTGWLVTRHDDVTAVYTDRRFSRTRPDGGARLYAGFDITDVPDSLINMEGERHARLRRLAAGPFLPRRAEAWRPVSAEVTTALLDAMEQQGPPADLVRDFAYPYPLKVICRLLGVPEADGADFRRWATLMMSVSEALAEEKAAGHVEFAEYLRALVTARRAEIAGGDRETRSRGGFLDDLILARDDDGSVLGEDELVAMVRTLIVAGHETTAGVVARGTLALLGNPEQADRFRAAPSAEAMAAAVEEIVRLETPGQGALLRYAADDTELRSGAVIPRGAAVFAPPSAANRDPERYPDPGTLDLGRDLDRNLGGHLAFGLGTHYCLGASLARVELQVAFAAIFQRFPKLRLAVEPEEVAWTENSRVRVPTSLPITW